MRLNRMTLGLILGLVTMLSAGSADAHGVFKKELEKKFPGMKVDCNTCHIDKKPKTDRNAFGGLFFKELESEELTKNWKDRKGQDKKDYEEKVMAPAFQKAMTTVMAMTFEEVIKAGLFEGIKSDGKTSSGNSVLSENCAMTQQFLPPVMMFVSLTDSFEKSDQESSHVSNPRYQIRMFFRRTYLRRGASRGLY